MGFKKSERKIKTRSELTLLCEGLRKEGKSIVTTNGCFDLLHIGHVHSLEEARMRGDVLVVGINSDSSVKRYKGDNRPIVPELERARMVAALECVSFVSIFDENDPVELIKAVRPDVHCKGAEYSGSEREIPEQTVVQSWGGRVDFIPLISGRSTTATISAIKNNG